MGLYAVWFRVMYGARPFASPELDELAQRMGASSSLSRNAKDRYFHSRRNLSGYNIYGRIILGNEYWSILSMKQRLGVGGHELTHVLRRHGRYQARHILVPSTVVAGFVLAVSFLILR